MQFDALTNPFPLTGYHGPEYFCDREAEIERLQKAASSGVNVSMISQRRMGKTALMHHLAYLRSRRKKKTLFVDVQPTANTAELIQAIANAVARDLYGPGSKMTQRILDFISRIGATLTFTTEGMPTIGLRLNEVSKHPNPTLGAVLETIEAAESPVLVMFDEFQDISRYPEKNIEALLRSHVQNMRKTRFLFSGSHKGMMQNMFADHRRPFYASTEHLYLDVIPEEKYRDYIDSWFATRRRKLDAAAYDRIFAATDHKTFHIQQIANRLWDQDQRKITEEDVNGVILGILKEQEHLYYSYRTLLTEPQWITLVAVAHEGQVEGAFSEHFRSTYSLGAPSTVHRSIKALVDRELVVVDKGVHRVEDPFLAGWIRYTFPRPLP